MATRLRYLLFSFLTVLAFAQAHQVSAQVSGTVTGGIGTTGTSSTISGGATQILVSGNMSGITTSSTDVLQIRFSLANCGVATPTVTGQSIIVATSTVVRGDGVGNWSTLLWGNDVISCNNVTSTLYQVTYLRNYVPVGTAFFYRLVSPGPVILTNLSPTLVMPPTGTASAGVSCAPGTQLAGLTPGFLPICVAASNTTLNIEGFNARGTWVAGASYQYLDIVNYLGTSYYAVQPIIGSFISPNGDPTDWAVLAAQGLAGPAQSITSTGSLGPWTSLALNGVLNADAYATGINGTGNNGIANASTSAQCGTTGCKIEIPPTSLSNEAIAADMVARWSSVHDQRYGSDHFYYDNPGLVTGVNGQVNGHYALALTAFWNLQPPNITDRQSTLYVNHVVSLPGYYPTGAGWAVNHALDITATAYSRSISQLFSGTQICYKLGDCGNYLYQHYRGWCWAGSDECAVGWSVQQTEDAAPYGTIVTGGANASLVKMNFTSNSGTQGDGLTLVSQNEIMAGGPGSYITALTNGSGYTLNSATTSDTHAVSTAFGTLNSACGTNTVRNAPTTSTCTLTLDPASPGSFTAGGGATVCVGDYKAPEQSTISLQTLSGTQQTITITTSFAHQAGVPIYQGGLCGGKLATHNGLSDPTTTHQMSSYWIAGSKTSTSFDYIIEFKNGQNGNLNLSSIVQMPQTMTLGASDTVTSTNGVVTAIRYVTGTPLNFQNKPLGQEGSIVFSGNSNASLNGTITGLVINSDTAPNLTWNQAGGYTGTGTGGTLTVSGLNGYTIYCGAETIALGGTTLSAPQGDGSLYLEPNNCNWTVGQPAIQVNSYAQTFNVEKYASIAFTPYLANVGAFTLRQLGGVAWSGGIMDSIVTTDTLTAMQGYGGNIAGHVAVQHTDYVSTYLNLFYGPINNGVVLKIGRVPAGSYTRSYGLWQLTGALGSCSVSFIDSTNTILSACPLQGPNPAAGDNSQSLTTTTWVNNDVASYNLGVAATATPATNVTSVTCTTSGGCTSNRGTFTVVGGTFTTGTFATLSWATLTTRPAVCIVMQNGGTVFYGLSMNTPSVSGMNFATATSLSGVTLSLSYSCRN